MSYDTGQVQGLQVTREGRDTDSPGRANAHSPIDTSFCRTPLLLTYALQPLSFTTLFALLFSAMGANVLHFFLSFSDPFSSGHICGRMEEWGHLLMTQLRPSPLNNSSSLRQLPFRIRSTSTTASKTIRRQLRCYLLVVCKIARRQDFSLTCTLFACSLQSQYQANKVLCFWNCHRCLLFISNILLLLLLLLILLSLPFYPE